MAAPPPAPPSATPTPNATPTPKRIALITCSTRPTRLNPQITAHIRTLISSLPPHNTTLTTLDISTFALPLLSEPGVPAQHPATNPTPCYEQASTRAWSTAIAAQDAFIFVTPQYNWSVPASLKNALDLLFHEWGGKGCGVVSYGMRGGGKGAGHLVDVARGLRMRVVGRRVEVKITEGMLKGGGLGEGCGEVWKGEGVDEAVGGMWEELCEMLEGGA